MLVLAAEPVAEPERQQPERLEARPRAAALAPLRAQPADAQAA